MEGRLKPDSAGQLPPERRGTFGQRKPQWRHDAGRMVQLFRRSETVLVIVSIALVGALWLPTLLN